MTKIVVIGAYGYTGKLICKELIRSQIEFAMAGRKDDKLAMFKDELASNIPLEVVDLYDEESVHILVGKYDMFVNCAGPFTETAGYLLKYISREGKCYFDITGELNFVQNSKERFHAIAKKNGACIVHSCAFESVLSNLLGTQMLEKVVNPESINVYYELRKAKPSPGTRLTMKLSKYRSPYFIQNGSREACKDVAAKEINWEGYEEKLGIAYPLPEVCFFDWQTSINNIGTYLIVDRKEVKYLSINQEKLEHEKDKIFDKYNKGKRNEPSEIQRKEQAFTIVLELVAQGGDVTRQEIRGSDMYLLTAKIMTHFVKVCIKKKDLKRGVLSPAQFLGRENSFFEEEILGSLDKNLKQ